MKIERFFETFINLVINQFIIHEISSKHFYKSIDIVDCIS